MSYNAASQQAANDAGALDHFPACPRCGNLCGRLAIVCADCGSRLHPTEGDLDEIAEHGRMLPKHVEAAE